jgi:Tfp pilus assembly PilM family ATPase
MLGFIRNFIPYQGPPVGVDLGQNVIRMAQIEVVQDESRLVHAAEFPAPGHGVTDTAACLTDALKIALRNGQFRGRHIAIGLDAGQVQVKHLRMPRTSAEEFPTLLKEHAEAALNAPASDFLLRGVVAGEVFGEQAPQQEVVLFATPQAIIQQMLDAASSARAAIVGVQVQPRISADYFARIYRQKADEAAVNLFVDLGHSGTRAFVAAPAQLRFMRAMPMNASQIQDRIAKSLGMGPADVQELRKSVLAQQNAQQNTHPSERPAMSPAQEKLVEETNIQASRLSDELEMCRRYYESSFPNQPVSRMIFIGGGARDRLLCSAIAQAMSLPAQIGDPLVRFNRNALPSLPCIDRRESMPQWSVAFGLSLCGQTVAHV